MANSVQETHRSSRTSSVRCVRCGDFILREVGVGSRTGVHNRAITALDPGHGAGGQAIRNRSARPARSRRLPGAAADPSIGVCPGSVEVEILRCSSRSVAEWHLLQ
jgi:hypothetical protein